MMNRLSVGLMLALAAWFIFQPHVDAQNGSGVCADGFRSPPEGPLPPKKLLAVRGDVGVSSDVPSWVRLRWVNEVLNTNCIVLQQRLSTYDPAGTWTTIITIVDPEANEYLHLDVPGQGEICYRTYAANEAGRSDYSNRVCLLLSHPQVPISPSAMDTPPAPPSNNFGRSELIHSRHPYIGLWVIVLVGLVVARFMLGSVRPRL